MARGVCAAVLLVVTLASLGVSGCATKDDSVWGRVESLDGPREQTEPRCANDLPPVVTPGEARQDSLGQAAGEAPLPD
jgi:hypothetical protein